MKHTIVAYLLQGEREAVALPTDDLQVFLDQVTAASTRQEHHLVFEQTAAAAFLHAIKLAMQSAKTLPLSTD